LIAITRYFCCFKVLEVTDKSFKLSLNFQIGKFTDGVLRDGVSFKQVIVPTNTRDMGVGLNFDEWNELRIGDYVHTEMTEFKAVTFGNTVLHCPHVIWTPVRPGEEERKRQREEEEAVHGGGSGFVQGEHRRCSVAESSRGIGERKTATDRTIDCDLLF